MWVPLVENNEHEGPGADYFVKKYLNALLAQSGDIDTVLLGCTHYPLLVGKIRQYLPVGVEVISQGEIVADKLEDYLFRHPEMERQCKRGGQTIYLTTGSAADFDTMAAIFMGEPVHSRHVKLQLPGAH